MTTRTLTTAKKKKMRTGGRCSCCKIDNHLSQQLYGKPLEIHHLQPISQGGSDDYSNLTCLCPPCHAAWHRYAEIELGLDWSNWKQYRKGQWKEALDWMYWWIADSGMPMEKKLHKLQTWMKACSWKTLQGA